VARKKTRHPDLFIKVRPLDRVALTKKNPVLPFTGGSVSETWIPLQGHNESPAIGKIDDQFFAADRNLASRWLSIKD